MDLRKSALSGVIWGFLQKMSNQLVTFVVGIILARILSPSDYGLVAMVTVFVAISGLIVDSGFTLALIRKNDRIELDYSTAFVINIVLSLLMGLILCGVGPFVASFYKEPILREILAVNGLSIFLGSFISIQDTRLRAELKFKEISQINMICSFVMGVISVVMAYMGAGVWSLVLPRFVWIVCAAGLYWYFQRWFPGFRFSKESAKSMFSFGSKLMLSSILSTVYNNLYTIVIGKYFSASNLGYYSRANAYASLPSMTIASVVGDTAYPLLSKIQNDRDALQRHYRKMMRMSCFVVFPLMIGLAALAKPFVIFLTTEKWLPSVVYIQLLCFSFLLYPVHGLNLNLLQVMGKSDLFLRLEVIKKVIGVLFLLVSLPFGVFGMCVGIVFNSWLSLFINLHYTSLFIKWGIFSQLKDLAPFFVISLFMGGVVHFITFVCTDPFIQLSVGSVFGGTFYFAVAQLLRWEEMSMVKNALRKILKKK